jgi:hypothetical protein
VEPLASSVAGKPSKASVAKAATDLPNSSGSELFWDGDSEGGDTGVSGAPTKPEVAIALRGAGRGGTGSVLGHAKGAFTKAGVNEHLYLVDLTDYDSASHADWQGDELLVIVASGGVTTVKVRGMTSIGRISDLNGDGVNELLLTGTFSHQGTSYSLAKLAYVSGGQVVTVRDFGEISMNSCGGLPFATQESWIARIDVTLRPNDWPVFKVTKRSQPC